MKLFKSLLVAPATLGLLGPLSATATEINFNAISNYSDETRIKNEEISKNNLANVPKKDNEEEKVPEPQV